MSKHMINTISYPALNASSLKIMVHPHCVDSRLQLPLQEELPWLAAFCEEHQAVPLFLHSHPPIYWHANSHQQDSKLNTFQTAMKSDSITSQPSSLVRHHPKLTF
mmetsp:Transcript_34142/g.53376  ORF Transcript_34142/g.53376 Transcript_34142/m.53376 type:complete len:105 (+) Transcript_34142:90-404(+)